MLIRRCDHCFKTYEESKFITEHHLVLSSNSHTFDLCSACEEALKNWFYNQEVKEIDNSKYVKPDIYGESSDEYGKIICDTYKCPKCGVAYEIDYEHYDYCPSCGQGFDWSDWDNEKVKENE